MIKNEVDFGSKINLFADKTKFLPFLFSLIKIFRNNLPLAKRKKIKFKFL